MKKAAFRALVMRRLDTSLIGDMRVERWGCHVQLIQGDYRPRCLYMSLSTDAMQISISVEAKLTMFRRWLAEILRTYQQAPAEPALATTNHPPVVIVSPADLGELGCTVYRLAPLRWTAASTQDGSIVWTAANADQTITGRVEPHSILTDSTFIYNGYLEFGPNRQFVGRWHTAQDTMREVTRAYYRGLRANLIQGTQLPKTFEIQPPSTPKFRDLDIGS